MYCDRPRYLATLAVLFAFHSVAALAYKIPTEKLVFEKYRPPSALSIQDRNQRVIDYWYGEKLSFYVPIAQIDSKLIDFVVLSEDAKFYQHEGFDLSEIKNSFEKNLESGKIKRGASTITQQLVKNVFLDKERSFTRKIFEIPWTMRVEKDFSKRQILELYLNIIEWGPGIYGAEAASRHFFDKSVSALTEGEALYLAMIIPNPNRFDLLAHPKTTAFIEKKRTDFVMRLISEKKIPSAQKESYLLSPFGLKDLDYYPRTFPLSHQGPYQGKRSDRARWLKDIEKNLRPVLSKSSKNTINLSLDFDLQSDISAEELQPKPAVSAAQGTYILIKENNEILAFRKISKTESLGEDFLSAQEQLGRSVERVTHMPWKSLAL